MEASKLVRPMRLTDACLTAKPDYLRLMTSERCHNELSVTLSKSVRMRHSTEMILIGCLQPFNRIGINQMLNSDEVRTLPLGAHLLNRRPSLDLAFFIKILINSPVRLTSKLDMSPR